MAGEPAEWPGTLRRSVEICVVASRAVLWNCRYFVKLKIIRNLGLEALEPSNSGSDYLSLVLRRRWCVLPRPVEGPCIVINGNCQWEETPLFRSVSSFS